ncbi:seroreactive antigen BMN1-9B [Babesia divergens]|uniref:Seroreactive antigen BMN1-9B n=1 Tax=Babesia divergens TaxID=32595 RepID=A0AAD9GHE3_BABDI|nr:seroreactive antigen BMN1-9B [Babesia divergens]
MDLANARPKGRPLSVHVRMMRFETDSSCLMDFESRRYQEDRATITPPQQGESICALKASHLCTEGIVYLVKKGSKLVTLVGKELLEPYLQCHEEAKVLARLEWGEKGGFLCNSGEYNLESSEDDCFIVMSNKLCRRIQGLFAPAKPMSHVIKEGDRIVFGRSTLVVRYLAHKPANSLAYLNNFMSQGSTRQTNEAADADMQNEEIVQTSSDRDTGCMSNNINATIPDSTMPDGVGNPNNNRLPVEHVVSPSSTALDHESEKKICRICLEDDEAGPLVVPCHCKGSMKYVHLSCVRTWVQGRLKVNDDNGAPQLSYFLQKLRCELCNVTYPSYVEVGSVVTEFLGIDEPAPPYAVLEPENATTTGLHLVTVVNGSASVGRGSHSAVIMHDISVSRLHALLHYKEGEFVIEDQGSKFGTLLQIDSNYRIPVDSKLPVILKIGRDILCISTKAMRTVPSFCCYSFQPNSVRVAM